MNMRIGSYEINTLDFLGDVGWVANGYHKGLNRMIEVKSSSNEQTYAEFIHQLVEEYGERR